MVRKSKASGNRTVFKSYIFKVVEKEVKVDGAVETFHIVNTIPATRVVAVEGENLVLIRQRRLKVGARREFIEVPGGAMDRKHKETAIQNAKRELAEETGVTAKHLLRLAPVGYTKDPGLGPGVFHFFLAKGLKGIAGQNLDKGESIKVVRLNLKTAVKMVKTGKIDDLATAFAILYYNQFKSGKPK
jgi:ADP-ribose pyrophosphatase